MPTYTRRAVCDQYLPPLASRTDPNCFLTVATAGQCSDCGRWWRVVENITWCSPVQVMWQCNTPAGSPDPIARIGTLEAKTVTPHRALPAVPALLLGGSSNLTVTWPAAFASATYGVEVVVPPALLGKLTAVVKAGSQTAAGVVITVTATAVVAVGSWLDVTATRYA